MSVSSEKPESAWEGPGAPDLGLTPIAEAVSSLLRSRGLTAAIVMSKVLACWEQAVGSELAAKIKPVSLRQKELVCEVEDPAWATQVKLLSDKVLSRLADEVGSPVAERLTVRVKRR
ncbi:MAG: DciA family protein [Acidimicrobiales bacterium]